MIPAGLLYGFTTFYGLKKLKRPMRKLAVMTTSQVFNAADHMKEAGYNFKEGAEDIIAEAQYENMKRKNNLKEETDLEQSAIEEDWDDEAINDYLKEE